MARIKGTEKAKKLRISAGPKLAPEPNGKSRPKTSLRPSVATNPIANHAVAGTHVYFAAELGQIRHTLNPSPIAQTMLNKHSVQIIVENEWDGVASLLRRLVSRMAVPMTAITRWMTTNEANFKMRNISRHFTLLAEVVRNLR